MKLFVAGTLLAVFCVGVSAQEGVKSLDLTYRGISVRPSLMPYKGVDKEWKDEPRTLSIEDRKKIRVLPSVRITTPDGSANLAVRPRRGGAELIFRMEIEL